MLIIVLYVDDLILTGDEELMRSCKEDLAREFEMKDMGEANYILGVKIVRDCAKRFWVYLKRLTSKGC